MCLGVFWVKGLVFSYRGRRFVFGFFFRLSINGPRERKLKEGFLFFNGSLPWSRGFWSWVFIGPWVVSLSR